jgi:hypothetical protein
VNPVVKSFTRKSKQAVRRPHRKTVLLKLPHSRLSQAQNLEHQWILPGSVHPDSDLARVSPDTEAPGVWIVGRCPCVPLPRDVSNLGDIQNALSDWHESPNLHTSREGRAGVHCHRRFDPDLRLHRKIVGLQARGSREQRSLKSTALCGQTEESFSVLGGIRPSRGFCAPGESADDEEIHLTDVNQAVFEAIATLTKDHGLLSLKRLFTQWMGAGEHESPEARLVIDLLRGHGLQVTVESSPEHDATILNLLALLGAPLNGL